ncbi:MAG: hypothetical protein ACXWC3_14740 [Burkholderiales bacterium]
MVLKTLFHEFSKRESYLAHILDANALIIGKTRILPRPILERHIDYPKHSAPLLRIKSPHVGD